MRTAAGTVGGGGLLTAEVIDGGVLAEGEKVQKATVEGWKAIGAHGAAPSEYACER